jgi:hypothetical protein
MATSYLSPGVYVEEVDRGTKPIEGVGTSVAAFIGFTERAEQTNSATLITNWNQFTQKFGGFVAGTFLPHAVYGYFANGGGRCYVISVSTQGGEGSPAQAALPTSADASTESLQVKALEGGQVGNNLSVEIKHDPAPQENGESDTFSFTVREGTRQAERYEGLTFGAGDNNVETVVNAKSTLVRVEIQRKTGKLSERRPAEGKFDLAGGDTKAVTVRANQFEGDVAKREGLGGLEALDDVTMVSAPDLMTSYLAGDIDLNGVKAVQGALLDHCERMKYRFAILDAPPGMSPQDIGEWRKNTAGYDSKYGALYYPWIQIANPTGEGGVLEVPPSGHMAGIYARSDSQRGVHKAPANEVVMGCIGLEVNVTKGEQDGLNPMGVNCIRAFPGRGIRVWGARTLTSDPSWRYINVRRLFNFVEASIEGGTQWVVFEPNDQDLWARVRRDVSAFLRNVWRSGALFGATPEEAFYVKCDEELNPPEVRDVGQLIIEVGMAPVKPAEFVIFRISQWAGPDAEA